MQVDEKSIGDKLAQIFDEGDEVAPAKDEAKETTAETSQAETTTAETEDANKPAVQADGASGAEAAASTAPDAQPTDAATAPEPTVPRKRLDAVLRARNDARREIAELRAELAQLKSAQTPGQATRPAAKSPVDAIDKLIEDALGEPESKPADQPDPRDDRIQRVESSLHELRIEREGSRIESDVSAAVAKYPGIPAGELKAFLLQAVVNDPSVSLPEVAERYAAYVGGIEQRALARAKPAAAPVAAAPVAPSTPPRPKTASAAPGVRTAQERPKTFEQAEASALRRLAEL